MYCVLMSLHNALKLTISLYYLYYVVTSCLYCFRPGVQVYLLELEKFAHSEKDYEIPVNVFYAEIRFRAVQVTLASWCCFIEGER